MTTTEISVLCDELDEHKYLKCIYDEVTRTKHWMALKTPNKEYAVGGVMRESLLQLISARVEEIERHFDAIKEG